MVETAIISQELRTCFFLSSQINFCKINFSVCEILFGIFNYFNGEKDVVLILNLTILLGKWFLKRCKSSERQVILSDFVNI